MTQDEMREELTRMSASLKKLDPPGSTDYMLNIPDAEDYLGTCLQKAKSAIENNKHIQFQLQLRKYVDGWKKVWTLMAIAHCEGRPQKDIDYRLFMHMPEGTKLEFETDSFGKFCIFPRVPRNPPKDIKWLTANDVVKMQEAPVIKTIMEEFDAWIDHGVDKEDKMKKQMRRAMEADRKKYKGKPTVWGVTGTKHGWTIYGPRKKPSKPAAKKRKKSVGERFHLED